MNTQPRIFCASINFQRLDKISDKVLFEVSIENNEKTLEAIRSSLGFPVNQVAVIKKCNAVIIVVTYFSDYTFDFIRGRLLSTWDNLCLKGLDNSYKYVKYYENEDALKFLCECAIGINSVTPGDSQVLAQVCNALTDASKMQVSEFHMLEIIVGWIKPIAKEAKRDTDLYKGYTSLERVAAEFINKNDKDKASVTVIGLGQTGSLVTKILSQELGLNVMITNRTSQKIKKMAQKFSSTKSLDYLDMDSIAQSSQIVIALPQNNETLQYISNLYKCIVKEVVVVDLSSPSISSKLVVPKNIMVCDVEQLTQIAHKVLVSRKPELDKARAIVSKSVPAFSTLLSKEFGKLSEDNAKKNISIQLDAHTLDILRVRDWAARSIREFYNKKNFVEVTTPYIVGVSSDPPKVDQGGAFGVEWPSGNKAFLRQSNQLYKQMIVASGLERIYEIGPFWRAEERLSYRHLLESTGLDVEVANPKSLGALYELAYTTIRTTIIEINKKLGQKEPCLLIPAFENVPILRYSEAVALLQSRGFNIKYGADLGLVGESKLGQIMRKEKASDVLIIKEYPDTIKKFYTKKRSNGETETFDIIVDGWEFVSGAIRNTDRRDIEKSMAMSGISPSSYNFYLSIVDNAIPHGGFCLGIDRLVAKVLDKETVAEATAFPRTTGSLIP